MSAARARNAFLSSRPNQVSSAPRNRFCSTVSCGTSENSWNTALIPSERAWWTEERWMDMKKDAVSLAEIAHEPYVMLTVDEADQTALRYWEPTPYRPKIMFATSSVEAVRSMVALNMGVTILSNMVYRPWSLEGQHVEVRPVTDHVPTMDVGLAWRRDTEMSPPVRVFYEYLDRTFRGSGHGFVNADVSAGNA